MQHFPPHFNFNRLTKAKAYGELIYNWFTILFLHYNFNFHYSKRFNWSCNPSCWSALAWQGETSAGYLPIPEPIKKLAYADDILAFLHDSHAFIQLQEAVSRYSKAYNALLNCNKLKLSPLSGQVHPGWKQNLDTSNINTWHDRQSTTPLYLGFAICSNITQRNLHFKQLCNIIPQTYNVNYQ